jgi:hypothetical protein
VYERAEAAADLEAHEWSEEVVGRVRQEISPEPLSELWQRGRRMTVDELVTYAVELVD